MATCRIGVISDTHDFLDPKVAALFEGVDHILHGGDVGLPWLLLQLENIAPVTAVLGNCDSGLDLAELEIVTLAERKFLIHHHAIPTTLPDSVRKRIGREAPGVVVFGHTHKPEARQQGSILFFNPGYAGRPRFNLPRSVAIMECREDGIDYRFLPL